MAPTTPNTTTLNTSRIDFFNILPEPMRPATVEAMEAMFVKLPGPDTYPGQRLDFAFRHWQYDFWVRSVALREEIEYLCGLGVLGDDPRMVEVTWRDEDLRMEFHSRVGTWKMLRHRFEQGVLRGLVIGADGEVGVS